MTNIINSRDRLSPQPNMSSDLISSSCQSNEVKVNNNTSETVALLTVQLPSDEVEIVHATTGRVRIRFQEGTFKSKLERISQHLRQQYGVSEVAANQQTGSMIVTFDENKLSLPQMLGLLLIHSSPANHCSLKSRCVSAST